MRFVPDKNMQTVLPLSKRKRQTFRTKSTSQIAIAQTLSNAPNCFCENVIVQPVVIAKLELSNVERQILAADLVIGADHTALNQRPETFNRIRVQRADDVLASGMMDSAMRVFVIQSQIAAMLVSREQGNVRLDSLANEGLHRGLVDGAQDGSD